MKNHAAVFFTALLIALIISSSLFAWGHTKAYGGDTEATASAFGYNFIAQGLNQLCGAPISILGHFTHNSVITIQRGSAFSIGGTPAVNGGTP